MLEFLLCSSLTILPDFLFRRFAQGKRIGREITLFSVWYELRWGITACLLLTLTLITVIFYFHPATNSALSFFRTVPVLPETNGRVAEVFVGLREEVEAGTPLFRLDSSEQQAAAESARRRIVEVDAALDVARIGLQVAEGRIAEAQGAYDQALEEYETRARLFERNPDAVSRREVEQAETLVEARQGALDAAIASRSSTEVEVNTLLPAQKASAQAELEEAAVELAKMTVYAGVTGRLEQFTLRPGDLVNPFMRPAGILIPREAGRVALQAGFGQIEAQVIRRGMIGEAACISVPFRIIPLVVTEVQSVIAAGQLRPTDQLVDPMQVARPGAITAYLEPLFQGGLTALPPGSSCIVNVYTSNHDKLESPDVGTLERHRPAHDRRGRRGARGDPAAPGDPAAGTNPRPLGRPLIGARDMRTVFGLMLLGVATLVAPAGAAEPMSAAQVAQALGFDRAAEQKLLAGEIVTAEREETTAKQLAVAIGMLIKGDPAALATAVLDGQTLKANPAILGFGRIDPAAPEAGLAGIAYTAGEVDEVRKLLDAKAGDEFNLSADELAALQKRTSRYDPKQAGDPTVVQAVNEAYRSILAGRLQAYLARGVAGIAPYQRDGEVSDPAEDLRAAAEASQVLQQAAPDLYRFLVDYPEHQPADVEQAFFWVKEVANDRPLFSLNHRMVQRRPDGVILLSRTFYAGHSFNASLSGAGVLPVQAGNAVFYTNRTSSDQVAGFMQGMRHEMGRGMMRDALIESFEAIRAQFGG